jgi:hypothetical protein
MTDAWSIFDAVVVLISLLSLALKDAPGLPLSQPQPLHPTPYTLHPTPYTLHPTPYTLHPTSYPLHPKPKSKL